MYLLGVGGSIHDFSACILENGKLISFIEEERITRKKHAFLDKQTFRCNAVDYCLNEAGITLEDVDIIVGNDIIHPHYYSKFNDSIKLYNHHLCHAASTYYPSPFENSAILIIDGRGSYNVNSNNKRETTSLYYGDGNNLKLLERTIGEENSQYDISNSIGCFYENVTKSIGFKFMQDGKTMGLAPYGTPKYVNRFNEFISYNYENLFEQTLEQIQQMRDFIAKEIATYHKEIEEFQIKADLAYAAQYHTEKAIKRYCNRLYKITKSKNLCIAGGVGLNSVANAKLLKDTPFENIFVIPVAGDAGTALGSVYYYYYNELNNQKSNSNDLFSPYLGKSYSQNDISILVNDFSEELEVTECKGDLHKEVATLISEGNIIGFFRGRSEIGPRALGNRSILADPRKYDMKDTINKRIKHREFFRPFAPVIKEEKQKDYFDSDFPSYYMLFVQPIREEKHSEIPAVTHVDGTGRLQTVTNILNPDFYSLIDEFEKITGCPVLLNTSFNDNGEPIVESPSDAIKCFLNIDLDYLVLENFILKKRRIDS